MESISDPELPLQRKEHAAFTKKINTFVPDTSSADAARESLQTLLNYLAHWLFNHILNSDIMIGKLPSKTEKASDPFAFTDALRNMLSTMNIMVILRL